MKFRSTIAAVALAGVSVAGGLAASASSDTNAPARAAASAKAAGKALASHKADKAVSAAETAVALAPREASYRTLLGQAYLLAGRYTSALNALGDALSLNPNDGTAALHYALAQIGTGDWSGARITLNTHENSIAPADRGLGYALAGDPVNAVQILTAAAREPGADAKTRQNLALSLALAGRWSDAKTVASLDMSPADVDKRMVEWIAFATPRSAADQVSALLGVTPVQDAGQPTQLALARTGGTALAAVSAPVDPVDAYMPKSDVAATGPVAAVAASGPVQAPIEAYAAPGTVEAAPVVASPMPVAAPIVTAPVPASVAPAPMIKPVTAPMKVRVAPAAAKPVALRAPAKGNYFVQLGAYENAAVARDGWKRLVRRTAALGSLSPLGMNATVNGANYYRLSVGGIARNDALQLCSQIRAKGGRCFVRASAGESTAAWHSPSKGVQVASR